MYRFSNIEPEISVYNRYKSFSKFLNDSWDTSVWNPTDYPLFLSENKSSPEREREKNSKASVTLSYLVFGSGRGHIADDDDKVILTIHAKQGHNTHDILMLSLIDYVQDIFELQSTVESLPVVKGIQMYDFRNSEIEEIEGKTLFPVIEGIASNSELSTEDVDTVEILFNVVSDRSSKLIDRRG